VSEHCLKLTTYSSERDRTTDGGLLTDELLRLYAEHGIRASVLLRGSEGFGRLAHLHTDRQLTLSEDLPAVSVAVDTRARIEAMLPAVLDLKRRGLITLERARLLSGDVGPLTLPGRPEDAAKLTLYLARQQRAGGVPAFVAACELLQRHGLAAATVLLGVDGTRDGRRARASLLGRNTDVPTIVSAVGPGPQIVAALPELATLLPQARITLERTRLCKRDGTLLAFPPEPPSTDERGLGIWQKLTVVTSQSALHEGHAIAPEIVRRLLASAAAGVTTLPGIWGFHGDHPPHGDRFLQLRRHVPVVTTTVDTPDRIAESFAIVDELTREHGLVTSEIVPAFTALSQTQRVGGLRLAEPGG